GRVSRTGESLSRRSTWRSSAEMTSAIVVLLPDGELGGVAGEAGMQDGGQAELAASFPSLVFEGALQHPLDADDVDHLELQGPAAGLLHALSAEALDQAEQPVDLAHPGPGQRVVEKPGRVDADLLSVTGGLPLQVLDVAHGVGALVLRQVLGDGAPAARGLTRVFAEQLTVLEDLDQTAVGARFHVLADAPTRNRVERLLDLDVMVAGD